MSAVQNPPGRRLVLILVATHVLAFFIGWILRSPETQVNATASQEVTERASEEPSERASEEPSETATDEPTETATDEASEEPSDATSDGGLTPALRLESATIEPIDLEDEIDEYVVFRFDGVVREVTDEAGFSVRDETGAAPTDSISAAIVEGSDDEVLVGFEQGTDLTQYLFASVANEAVLGTSRGNVPATVELTGSEVSMDEMRTSGPDFVMAKVNPTLDLITYHFDSTLDDDTAAPTASDFGYRTRSGRDVEAADVLSVDGQTVTLAFDAGDEVEDGVRYFVRAGAVMNRLGQANPPGVMGDDTTAPELESVSRVEGSTQYDFTFTQPVALVEVGGFAVYTLAGEEYVADDWMRMSPQTLRLHVPEVRDFADAIVLGAVDVGAVRDTTNAGDTVNGVGAVAVDPLPEGSTAGPQLVSVTLDESTGQVRFQFTIPLDDDATIDPADFQAIIDGGELVPGTKFIEVDDDTVVIGFAKNVAAAAEDFAVNDGAVSDEAGIENAPAVLMPDTAG